MTEPRQIAKPTRCPECGNPLFYALNHMIATIDLTCTEACGAVDINQGDIHLDAVPMPDRLVQKPGGGWRAVFDR